MPIALFIILLIFRFISATVEEYIAAGITYISDYFELSESMGAVTLIALANGYFNLFIKKLKFIKIHKKLNFKN